MEMLTKSEIKQKTETIMFNNMVIDNSDLLISVEGCKDKQNISTVDLIKTFKMKKKILDRSIKEVDPDKMFKPQETMLELNRNRYLDISSDNRHHKSISSREIFQNQIEGGSLKILEEKHTVRI